MLTKLLIQGDAGYQVFDNKLSEGGPSKWTFSSANSDHQGMALSQTKAISCSRFPNCLATLTILRFKYYYDAEITVKIKMTDQNLAGICIFEFSVQSKGPLQLLYI